MASTRLGTALRQIQRLFVDGAGVGLTDAQLWERFATERDADAFAALVERHGRTVLAVCRGVLNDPSHAEDVFQATFLVLLRKAGSLWAVNGSLASWLYRVAFRIAIEANRGDARRRAVERRAAEMVNPDSGRAEPGHDFLPALHEEIGRLPEKYRAPIVLCHLEQMTHAEAAHQLGWTVGTVRGRVAQARDLLRTRLTRRGLMLSGTVLTTVFSNQAAQAVVPSEWIETMVEAATRVTAGQAAAGTVSAAAVALSERLTRGLFITKAIWTAAALLVAGGAAGVALSLGAARKDDGRRAALRPPAAVSRTNAAAAKAPEAADDAKPVPISGRVLGPDGKPVPGAGIYIRHRHFTDLGQEGRAVERVAESGPDGRFRFDLDPSKSNVSWPPADGPAWHSATIAAFIPGHGADWVSAGDAARAGAELHLVPDDVPVSGRIIDSQGRAVAGAGVRVERLAIPVAADLDSLLASGRLDWDGVTAQMIRRPEWYQPTWIGRDGNLQADAEGRFVIAGVGHDRVAVLAIDAPGLERAHFAVLVRTPRVAGTARPRSSPTLDPVAGEMGLVLHGASFEHVVGPSKPITGLLLAKGTGQPAAGVIVAGQIWGNPWTVVFAKTDAGGRFRLEGLPKAATYHVDVRVRPGSPYLAARPATVSDTEGLKPVEVSFELPPGVPVRGRIIDKETRLSLQIERADYFPLPSNRAGKDATRLYASVEGETFLLTVPPGQGMIVAKVRGKLAPYPAARLDPADRGKVVVKGEGQATFGIPLSIYHAYRLVDLPPGDGTAAIDLEVAAVPGRRGQIVGSPGRALTGVKALGLSSDRYTVQTVEGSVFEVRGLRAEESRVVEMRNEELGLAGAATVSGSGPADQPVIVELARCGALSGRILDEDGIPLRGAKVTATVLREASILPADPAFRPREGEADREGRFRIDGLTPLLDVRILFEDPNHPPRRYESKPVKDLGRLAVKPGEVRDLGDIRVRAQQIR